MEMNGNFCLNDCCQLPIDVAHVETLHAHKLEPTTMAALRFLASSVRTARPAKVLSFRSYATASDRFKLSLVIPHQVGLLKIVKSGQSSSIIDV